ncbi:MAG: zf-TFIIB domain-containing protein [Ferruginibacter sp.]|nr:zf-TFIIB domain-containing protein [Chitinophagaceae bacterium]MBU9935376.1 zf-TFIIB domain-containing protein [Ferruginibacter sp.]
MKCPNCEEFLVMTERQGIEIDYCPKCRGVWLDRGELDKIIEKSVSAESSSNSNYPISGKGKQDDYYNRDDWSSDRNKEYKKNYNKSKGSFLSDLFD